MENIAESPKTVQASFSFDDSVRGGYPVALRAPKSLDVIGFIRSSSFVPIRLPTSIGPLSCSLCLIHPRWHSERGQFRLMRAPERNEGGIGETDAGR